ncbi:MAG: MBL fold metallo-hydrolase [Actinomycetia bacterium]|nr:MBL fold metallo-hydrolase [Actinomycetes bacterium]
MSRHLVSPTMRLTILGSSGTYPAPSNPASGYLIEAGSTRVWCEAGPGTFATLTRRLDLTLLDAVVVSHRHPDHCMDLLSAYHAFAYGPMPRRGIPLYAPEQVFESFLSFLGQGPDGGFSSVFELHTVSDGDEVTVGNLGISFAAADHTVPTVASRWSDGRRSMAYSADTGPRGDWARLVQDAHLFLCEAAMGAAPYLRVIPHHLTAEQAGQIARERQARRLMLTHIPPHIDSPEAVAEAERSFDRPVALAVPGAAHRI